MAMTVEDSQFLTNIQQKVLRNKEEGKSLKHGISVEEYKRFLAILRPARTSANAAAKKSSSTRKQTKALSDEEAAALLKF